MAAAAKITSEIKKPGRDIVGATRNENYMVLATSYVLNNSDTKRIQIGLKSSNKDGTFKPVIKLSGNSSTGVYLDWDTWEKFQQNIDCAGSYLRGHVRDAPEPVSINNITVKYTSAYGIKAIMIGNRREEENNGATTSDDSAPPAKKRKTYEPSIVMQKTTFEGLENIVRCINVRYNQLQSLVNLVNDCTRFLIAEIELNLPNIILDEKVVEQTLATNFQTIEENVRRQIPNVQFLDTYFEIVFEELASIHLHEIVRKILTNASS